MLSLASRAIYPIITFGSILLLWLFAVHVADMPSYLIPAPGDVVGALYTGYVGGAYWEHFFFTLKSTALGYLAGCSAAFVLGAVLAESRTVERLIYPLIVSLQAMPKVALAPLLIVWFGYEIESKIIMVALICFFPLFVNTVTGLKQVDPALLDLSRAFSASRWLVFSRIKLPSAAGHIFAGLQISILLSLIGAVVAEFVSSTKGLGYMINAAAVNLDTHVMFAALISLAVLGLIGSALVRFIHTKVVFWDKGTKTASVTE